MTEIVLPIFFPVMLEGFVMDEAPRPPSSPMRCLRCERVQVMDTARLWNRGTCYSCAGPLANIQETP